MSKDKVLQVIGIYRDRFVDMGIGLADHSHSDKLHSPESGLKHCHGMLDKIEEFVRQDRMEKVFRWLGFIQGFLWGQGIYTLDELKEHNRP